jgi:hypothetical protein
MNDPKKTSYSPESIVESKNITIPVASINLHPHADCSPVVAVGQKANLAGPDWRVQLIFRLEVRVLVAGDHLKQRRAKLN